MYICSVTLSLFYIQICTYISNSDSVTLQKYIHPSHQKKKELSVPHFAAYTRNTTRVNSATYYFGITERHNVAVQHSWTVILSEEM